MAAIYANQKLIKNFKHNKSRFVILVSTYMIYIYIPLGVEKIFLDRQYGGH